MTTTFETAKVGDKVWCVRRGWGVIRDVVGGVLFPIHVVFPNKKFSSYTLDGLVNFGDTYQTLFWDEIAIEAPAKPMPDLPVDAKVLVWDRPEMKLKMHFSHFKDGHIVTFKDGKTSFTTYAVACWPNWELAE